MNKFYRVFTVLFLSLISIPAFAQEQAESFDFMAELMSQIPIAIRELVGSGAGVGIIIVGGVFLSLFYEIYKNIEGHNDTDHRLVLSALKIGLGLVVLTMVWGVSPVYSGTLSESLNRGATHPDAGRYPQVDMYYAVHRFSDSIAKVMFPVMDDEGIDAVADKIEKKTNVLAFSNGCQTEECFTKLKEFYNQNDRAPDSMTELYGTEMEDPSFGMTEIVPALKYYAAKFINIGTIIQFMYFIFKILLQVFLFMNNVFLTVIAQLTLLLFMITSFQVLSPRLQDNFKSSLRSLATVSLFNFALSLVNGLTMTLLGTVDLTIGRSIAYLGGTDTSSVVLKAVCMVVAILVMYAISLKMIPSIAQAITSGNLNYLNNLGEQLANGVMAVGVAAAGAGLGAVPYVGAVAGSAAGRFWNSFRPGGGGIPGLGTFKNWFSGNKGGGPSASSFAGPGGPSGGGGGSPFAGMVGGGKYYSPRPAALPGGGIPSSGAMDEARALPSRSPIIPKMEMDEAMPGGQNMPSAAFSPNFTMGGTSTPKVRKTKKAGSKGGVSFAGKDSSRSRANFALGEDEPQEETTRGGTKKRRSSAAGAKASSGRKSSSKKGGAGSSRTREEAYFSDFSAFGGKEYSDDDRFHGGKRSRKKSGPSSGPKAESSSAPPPPPHNEPPEDDIIDADWEDISDFDPRDLENMQKSMRDGLEKASNRKTVGDFFRKDNLKSVGLAAAKVAGLGMAGAFNVVRDTAFAGALNDYDTLAKVSVNPTQDLGNKTKETWSKVSIQTQREILEKKISKIEADFAAKMSMDGASPDDVESSLNAKYGKDEQAKQVIKKMTAEHKAKDASRKKSKAKGRRG